jgi:hypothetical protein
LRTGSARCGEVEHLHLVDLALVQSLPDGLVGPQAELGVPQRAVGLRVTWVSEGREVAEHVEQVAALAQCVDQRGVAGAGVLRRVAVLDQVHAPIATIGALYTGSEPAIRMNGL